MDISAVTNFISMFAGLFSAYIAYVTYSNTQQGNNGNVVTKTKKIRINKKQKISDYFPLNLIPLVIYILLVLIDYAPRHFNTISFSAILPSGAIWKPTSADILVLFSVFLVFAEFVRLVYINPETNLIFHQMTRVISLIAHLIVFIFYPWGGNSILLILLTISFFSCLIWFLEDLY